MATTSSPRRFGGLFPSYVNPQAKLTTIIGEGQENFSERLLFNGQVVTGGINPFRNTWDNPTFDVSTLLPGNAASATIRIDHQGFSSFDCLSGGAFIFRTTVQDADTDGLPDALEDSSIDVRNGQPWTDALGDMLPNISAMGAGSNHKDVFIEIGAMRADAGTAYGAGAARQEDPSGHNHLPTPAALKLIGDAFKNAPVTNIDGVNGIRLHIDVGPGYHSVGAGYSGTQADEYLIGFAPGNSPDLARGGESIKEVACVEDTQTPARWACQFPAYPGTVMWKIGFQRYKEAFVHDDGTELVSADELAICQAEGTAGDDSIAPRRTFSTTSCSPISQGSRKSSV